MQGLQVSVGHPLSLFAGLNLSKPADQNQGTWSNSVFLAQRGSQCFHLYACRLKSDLPQQVESIGGLSALECGLGHGLSLQSAFFQERGDGYLLSGWSLVAARRAQRCFDCF